MSNHRELEKGKSCYEISQSSMVVVDTLSSHAFHVLLSPASSSGSPGNSEKSFQRLPHCCCFLRLRRSRDSFVSSNHGPSVRLMLGFEFSLRSITTKPPFGGLVVASKSAMLY